jgi:hypothetical protein
MKMATKCHERGGRGDHQQMSKANMDKELTKVTERIEHIALQM